MNPAVAELSQHLQAVPSAPPEAEVGPGRTLSKRWNDQYPEVPARSIDDFRGPDAGVAWVKAALRT